MLIIYLGNPGNISEISLTEHNKIYWHIVTWTKRDMQWLAIVSIYEIKILCFEKCIY